MEDEDTTTTVDTTDTTNDWSEHPISEPDTPAAEPAAEEPAAAEEPWALNQDDWTQYTSNQQAMAEFLGQYAPVLDQMAGLMQGRGLAQQEPGSELPEYDPFNPASVDDYVNARIEQAIEGRLGPVEEFINNRTQQDGMQIADQVFDRLAEDPEVGEFDRDAAHLLADAYVARTNADPFQALGYAATKMAAVRKEAWEAGKKAGQEELRTQLANVGGARREPGINTGAPATENLEVPTGANWGVIAAERITV